MEKILKKLKKNSINTQKGMTLLEIMVVLVIMGLIMGAVTVGVMTYLKKAKRKTTKTQVNRIADIINVNAADLEYKGKKGKELLDALMNEGLIKKKMLNDAWGNEVRVEYAGAGSDHCVISAGADESFGTADDIKSADCSE
jgi:general secretion pathway protein G